MKNIILKTMLFLLAFTSTNLIAQDLFIKSDLEGLTMRLGDSFEPETYVENL